MGSPGRQVGRARRRQAVLECATGVVTAAAAGLFAQPLGYIYPGRRAAPRCRLRSATRAGRAGEYRRSGRGARGLLAPESSLIDS